MDISAQQSLATWSQSQLALLPAMLNIEASICFSALADRGSPFLDFVLHQNLGPLWHYRLQAGGLLESLPGAWIDSLRISRIKAAAEYLRQRMELERLDKMFADQAIPYLVMKGTQTRECVYPDPALRPASDIDILILPQDRRRTADLLLNHEFTVLIQPKSINLEATFRRNQIDVDLHWHVMRPSRMRFDMTEGFLARRQREQGIWRLSDSDTVFVMLTHPAFTKYVNSPNMGLARVADFLLWIQQRDVNWPVVFEQLQRAGLKTAAWTMLSWFSLLVRPETVRELGEWINALGPGRLRRAYLHFWLTHDLSTRWLLKPLLIQFGLTLMLHDRLSDALHALRGILQARRDHLRDARILLGEAFSNRGEAHDA